MSNLWSEDGSLKDSLEGRLAGVNTRQESRQSGLISKFPIEADFQGHVNDGVVFSEHANVPIFRSHRVVIVESAFDRFLAAGLCVKIRLPLASLTGSTAATVNDSAEIVDELFPLVPRDQTPAIEFSENALEKAFDK